MNGEYICTAEKPWTEDVKERTVHQDAKYIDERDFGLGEYCERYKCPHCGKEFYVELPQ